MIKKYLLYLLRWQLSTPILAICVYLLASMGTLWATIIANFVGGILFFWVDRYIFNHTNIFKNGMWEVVEDIECFDCKEIGRCYRLVKNKKYNRENDKNPQFRCEICSQEKFKKINEKS